LLGQQLQQLHAVLLPQRWKQEDCMPMLQLLFEQEGSLPWLQLLLLPPAFIA
jgi:hypothetical protein